MISNYDLVRKFLREQEPTSGEVHIVVILDSLASLLRDLEWLKESLTNTKAKLTDTEARLKQAVQLIESLSSHKGVFPCTAGQ